MKPPELADQPARAKPGDKLTSRSSDRPGREGGPYGQAGPPRPGVVARALTEPPGKAAGPPRPRPPSSRRQSCRTGTCRAGRPEHPMRLIPARLHGILDHAVGAPLVLPPPAFGFSGGAARIRVPVALETGAISYGPLADDELGLARLIPLPAPLPPDAPSGVLLAASARRLAGRAGQTGSREAHRRVG